MDRNLLSTRRMDTLSIFDTETFLVKCSIGLLSKLQITLPRPALMTIHKALKKKKKKLKKSRMNTVQGFFSYKRDDSWHFKRKTAKIRLGVSRK